MIRTGLLGPTMIIVIIPGLRVFGCKDKLTIVPGIYASASASSPSILRTFGSFQLHVPSSDARFLVRYYGLWVSGLRP